MFIFAVNKYQRLCKKTAQRKILWNLTVPVKEIAPAYHCEFVIPTERSDEGSLFHNYCKYFADPHLFATEPFHFYAYKSETAFVLLSLPGCEEAL